MRVVARCCVSVLFVIQLSRSSQASPWLEHQDDVSGFTCIGYRAGVVAKNAKEGTQRAQRTLGCAELVWWLAWWFWVIRQRLLLEARATPSRSKITPTANRWCVRPTRSLSMGAYAE